MVRSSSNTLILYHQTSHENARKILRDKAMKPGSDASYAGSGIYFATTPRATNRKARCTGVILSCKVHLGRVKEICASGDWSPEFWQMWYGYDSIKITSLNGVEYVVFDPKRVKTIGVHSSTDDYSGLDLSETLQLAAVGTAVYAGLWCAAPVPMAVIMQ
jgi:hypothetical protein